MDNRRYIAVEGVIGSGKSLFAKALADSLKARLVADIASQNPFLENFYKDPRGFAFATQIFYLLNRFRQQQELSQAELFGGGVVTDYLFARDRIFAHLCLSDAELSLYEQLHRLLRRENLPQPDLVVYLQAPVQQLAEKLEEQGLLREEGGLSRQTLEQLCQAYNSFFFNYTKRPLLIANTHEMDLAAKSADRDDLISRVLQTHGGTQYYAPKK